MDIFGRFARSPDCLVAIDAADGGTWRSPFRPGVVYPSAVPRNFATEPATRYDLRAAFVALGTNDFRYTMKFTIFDNSAASYAVLGVPGQAYPIGAVKINATTTNFRLATFSNGPGGLNKGDIFNVGSHTLVIEVVGKQVTITLDGASILSWNAGAGTRIAILPYNSLSNMNGTIDEESLVDLTLGKTIFSYPTFEKKTRLLMDSNCAYSDVIAAATSEAAWSIKYGAPAPTGDYTAVIDTTAAVIAQVRKSGVTATYTNGVSGGTLPYLTLGTSTLSGAYGTKMRHFLLFDRALSIGEIQLLR